MRSIYGLFGAAIVACLLFLGLVATNAVTFTAKVDVRYPVATQPNTPAPSHAGPECNITKDDTRVDFESSGKENPGSIGPRVGIDPGAEHQHLNNLAIHAVLCGDSDDPERGANQLAYGSILTGLFGLESGKPRHVSDREWRDPKRGVKWLVEKAWLPGKSRFECDVIDPPGRKTVYALDDNGLKLGVTDVKPGRTSCYAHLTFSVNGVERIVVVRADCELQVVTLRGRWNTVLPE